MGISCVAPEFFHPRGPHIFLIRRIFISFLDLRSEVLISRVKKLSVTSPLALTSKRFGSDRHERRTVHYNVLNRSDVLWAVLEYTETGPTVFDLQPHLFFFNVLVTHRLLIQHYLCYLLAINTSFICVGATAWVYRRIVLILYIITYIYILSHKPLQWDLRRGLIILTFHINMREYLQHFLPELSLTYSSLVLAGGIVFVFTAGFLKLWYMNRWYEISGFPASIRLIDVGRLECNWKKIWKKPTKQ